MRTSKIERGVLNKFQGGCQLPLGVYCEESEDEDGKTVFKVWAAKADDSNGFPKYIYLETKHKKDIDQLVVDKVNRTSTYSVFITRNIKETDFFYRCLSAHGYKINGKALIQINRIPFKELPQTEWVFFASKNAVKHFFGQNPVLNDKIRIGVIGTSTAAELRKYGYRAEFIGYSTDTKLTSKQFLAKAGNSKVLFPQAKGSIKRVQQYMNQEHAFNLPVYESIKNNDGAVPEADIVLFTSPSNVLAFFEKNEISSAQKIIAMGHATGSTLKKKGIMKFITPPAFDEIGLVQAVFGIK
jgi:hydroxymethylbilane synthase